MMELHSEVIKHMLAVVDPKQFSALLRQPLHWAQFQHWCGESPDAHSVMRRAEEQIETVCMDQESNLYCVAMSMSTLESIVKDLAETYEDEELVRLFS